MKTVYTLLELPRSSFSDDTHFGSRVGATGAIETADIFSTEN